MLQLTLPFANTLASRSAEGCQLLQRGRGGDTSFRDARERARRIVGEMTDDERYDLVVGGGFVIRENARLGLPEIKLFDATSGVHLRETVASGHLHRSV